MKKFIAIITLVSMLSCVSCGEKAESSAAATSSGSAVESSADESSVDESSAEESSEIEAEATPVNEEDYFDWYGVNMYYPQSDMNKDESNNCQVSYNFDKEAKQYTEIYTFAATAGENMPEISASDVINDESVFNTLCENIDLCYSCYKDLSSFNPESEEKVEVLGKEFIKQKGTFHAEGNDDPTELSYVAYFGSVDFKEKNYTNCPVIWIALSELNDDATKAQLEKRVDTAAQNMEYLK